MKVYISIITALVSFFTASYPSGKGGAVIEKDHCPEYVYYLQECSNSCELPSDALATESNYSTHHTPEGKSVGHPFARYGIKQGETTNKCGRNLSRISLLHNSLPAITAFHRHIFLLGRLII
ncbi:MAG: hypothetical protein J6Q34_08565 [Bacteroidales bacterium]|nr:hypothetical protein [Bacteroidales bacterium]